MRYWFSCSVIKKFKKRLDKKEKIVNIRVIPHCGIAFFSINGYSGRNIMDLNRKKVRSEKTAGGDLLVRGGLLARGNPFMIMRCAAMCCQRGRRGLSM
jgi:hypothetical protein